MLNEQLRLGLSAADLTALYARTEGWVAGLRLLANSLQQVPPFTERTAFITEVVQSSRYVFDLLAEEVLNHQEPAIRTFLLETSILSELTPVVCQAVTGRQNAELLLAELYHRHLFLVAIADERQPATDEKIVPHSLSLPLPPVSYRYHDLFADFLRQQLAREMPERLPELHRRAAEAQTSPSRTINHYLAANLWPEAAQTIERVGEQLLQQGWLASLQGWIQLLPAGVRQAHPRLAYLLGVCALHQRTLADAGFYLEQALHAFETAANQLDQGKTLAYLSSLAFFQADFARGLALIEQALACPIPPDTRVRLLGDDRSSHRYRFNSCPIPPDTRVRLLVERARIAHFQGDFAHGEIDLDRAWRICQESGDLAAVYTLLEGFIPSFAAMPAGLDRLEQLCRIAATKTVDGEGLLEVVLYEQQAMVHCYRGEIARTLQAAERALRLGERLGGHPLWQYWTLRIFILTAHTALGHRPQAEQIIEQLLAQQDSLDVLAKSGFLYFVAHACWLHQRWPDAYRIYQQLRRMEIPPDSLVTHTMLAMLQGILELAEGRYATALPALQEAVAFETKSPLFNVFGSARVLLSYLYLKMGRPKEALAEIELALAECGAQGAPGRILIEGAAAIPVLRLALEHNRQPVLAGQLLETLEASRRSEPQPVAVPDTGATLSPREVEVLGLLAAGASNQEIAQTLVLSIHTVKRHVANILVKLNVANRTQASSRARELGVVD